MEDNKQKRYEKPKMPRSPLFWVLVALLGLLLDLHHPVHQLLSARLHGKGGILRLPADGSAGAGGSGIDRRGRHHLYP